MSRNKYTISFLEQSPHKKGKGGRKIASLIKSLGGRKGVLLSSIIMNPPKYKDLI
jgi:hypothetical protein